MKQHKIAVIGCGGVSSMHFDGYITHPERLHIAAACDLDLERAQQAQQKYDFPQAFDSLPAMIQQADWEIGVVCTPTPVRLEVVKTLAAAGKQIYVEKPLADSYAEAQAMVNLAEAAGVKLAVDQNFRYHYPFDHARRLVEEGKIGNLVSIAHQELTFRQDRGWRLDMPRHSLSVMGVHWFDGFRWIAQDEPKSIACQTRPSPAIQCAGETDAFALLTFQRGVMVSYAQSFSSPFRRSETVVIGDEGALVLHYDDIALYTKENRTEPKEQWTNPYAGRNKPESAYAGLEELLAALDEEREPSNSGRDNLKTIAILDAAYCSAEEGREIAFTAGVAV
jgi:predicted dehydrogenase